MTLSSVLPILRGALLASVSVMTSLAGTIVLDFSANDGGFTASSNVANGWTYGSGAWTLAGANSQDAKLTSPTFQSSGGEVVLQFVHTRNMEAVFDGGAVELSVNGSAFSYVPNSSFSQNGYNGAIVTTNAAFPSGTLLFNGNLPDPLTSIVSLGIIADTDSYAFRFRAGSDPSVTSSSTNAWRIGVQQGGSDVPEPSTAALLALGGLGLAAYRVRRRRA